MKTFFLPSGLLAVTLCFYACNSQKSSASEEENASSAMAPDTHNSQNALDWFGNYMGTLPCADCAGIKTTITLNQDQTYQLTRVYQGESEDTFEEDGQFEWNNEGNTITLRGIEDGPNQYFVGENFLRQLDMQGERISGELAENYILMKSNQAQTTMDTVSAITNVRWRLVELMGKSVDSTINNREPFLLLNTEEQRVNANAGCNNIMGTYELMEGNRIRFSRMASTQMACPDMEIEDQFLKVFESVDNYSISEGQLSLNRARMAPLARFVAVAGE
ncbi:copper resistance protein NlpE N-terminal domain-containing protein [Catalinimonas sp. 4WD22]|uniref:copper resistance protein NlpE N-terminal domain-containing protein n=1 Tax=Catalinimonas locisalis TaxID=3133978 RepID=UPI003100DA49